LQRLDPYAYFRCHCAVDDRILRLICDERKYKLSQIGPTVFHVYFESQIN
jgi:hypothetical protein